MRRNDEVGTAPPPCGALSVGPAALTAVTTEGVTQTQQAAGELSRMSAELQSLVDQFKV